jgi:photosystem II stability/assembly factor-like uncharacterized protein
MRLRVQRVLLRLYILLSLVLVSATLADASEWTTVSLPARSMNITERNGVFWVCGADELVASSEDGGKTWHVKHSSPVGGVLLTVGFANDKFGYAAGTGGLLVTKDGGSTWSSVKTPSTMIYAAVFGDEKHGLIHTPHVVYNTADGGSTWTPVSLNFKDEQGKYTYVLELAAVDASHMMIVMSVGNAPYYSEKFIVTSDGGATWKPTEIPSTNSVYVAAHASEYWLTGGEVIEKDKPGGGYSVPLLMHSKDGEHWTHVPRWSRQELSSCSLQGCLYWDGAGFYFSATPPPSFWRFAAEKAVTANWAIAKDTICSVGDVLRCAAVLPSADIPSRDPHSSTIPVRTAPPALDTPPRAGAQCLLCNFERVVVTDDFQGLAEVDLTVNIAANGLVTDVKVDRATRAEIGDKIAASARNWIFIPYEEDGVVHPVLTHIKLQVQAIKSK